MQRTSTRFFGCCMWQPSSMKHLVKLCRLESSKILSRHLASSSFDKNPIEHFSNKSTSSRTTGPYRPTMREDNMWKDPHKLNTEWLRPNDTRRYKPDFKQTEPEALRNQFMRSPDERVRDAMARDFEAMKQFDENRRRQTRQTYQDTTDRQNRKNRNDSTRRRTKSKLSNKNRMQNED